MKVVLTDGRDIDVIFYRAFSVKGERYSIFLDIKNAPKGENYQAFVLKDEADGLFSVPDNALIYSIIDFIQDLLNADTHFYTQRELDMDLREL